ncbi:MAG: glycosyltransferase family 25 protein [Methyloceanibacter sp.]
MVDLYLINLARSHQRLEEFEQHNKGTIAYSRFAAVDGKLVSRADLTDKGIVLPGVNYSDGAIGCALSHLGLWELASKEGKIITVCEDDAIFNKNFTEIQSKLLTNLGSNFDLVLWGWNFDSILAFDLLPGVSPCLARFDQASLRTSVDKFRDANFSPKLFRLHRAFGIPSYTVSPVGAEKLKETCFPIRSLNVFFPGLNRALPNNGIDIPMNEAYPRMRALVSFPPLVVTKNDHSTSTVQGR